VTSFESTRAGVRGPGRGWRVMKALQVAMKAMLVSGVLLLVLGLLIWTGNADQLIGVHIAFGVVLVLSLWTICAVAARAGVASGTVAFAAAWGALVVALGLAQEELLTGGLHWVIQVVHVAVSMGAIWWGKRLAAAIQQGARGRASDPAASPPVGSTTPR